MVTHAKDASEDGALSANMNHVLYSLVSPFYGVSLEMIEVSLKCEQEFVPQFCLH